MKFPTRPLLVLLGLVVALGFAEIAIRAMEPLPVPSTWPTPETQLKARQMSTLDGPVDVLFVGSSITEAAVDPTLVVNGGITSAYNAAAPFMDPPAIEIWLRDVAVPLTMPSFVVIGLTPWPPSDSHIQDDVVAGLDRAVSRPSLGESDHASFALWRNRGVFADFDYLLDQLLLAESGLWTDLGHQTGYHDLPRDFTAGLPRVVGARRMSGPDEVALRRSVGQLQSHSVEVILMIEPTSDRDVEASQATAGYIAWLEELASDLGVELWDMYSITWPDSLYTDNDHFNAEGTEQFSALVGERLSGMGDAG